MPIKRVDRYRLLVIGSLAGLFSGLFGVGGGTVMVPLLVLWLAYEERKATGTSLVAIVVIAAVGVTTHAFYGNVELLAAAIVGVPAVLGVLQGVALQQRISNQLLVKGFALLMLLIAAKFLLDIRFIGGSFEQFQYSLASVVTLLIAGFAAGVLAGLFGVGGGILFVPVLTLVVGFDQVTAEATSLLAIIPVSIVGAARQQRNGNVDLSAGILMGVLACVGAVAGVVLVNELPQRVIEIGFALLSIFVAWRLWRQAAVKAQPGSS